MNKKRYNRHHIIGRSMNKNTKDGYNPEQTKFNVDHPDNLVKMLVGRHRALHELFTPRLNDPKRQLEYLVDLRRPVLSTASQALLDTLLLQTDEEFYKEDIVQRRRRSERSTTEILFQILRCFEDLNEGNTQGTVLQGG